MLEDHRALQDQLISSYGGRIFMRNWPDTVSHKYEAEDENWVGDDQYGKFNYNNWAYLYGDDWQDHHLLENEDGVTLDRMYVSMMASDHAKLLAEINRCDMDTSNDAIKTIISNVRPQVERHLGHARDLRSLYWPGATFTATVPW